MLASWSWDECCAYHVLVLLVSPVGSTDLHALHVMTCQVE